jgi:molecular chaperone GrpE
MPEEMNLETTPSQPDHEEPDHEEPDHEELDLRDDHARLARALTELDAARARVERDARRVNEDTRSRLVAELLPVLDNLDRTIRAAAGTEEYALVDGVRLVRAQLESVLRGFGVERIDAIDKPFDPKLHDAIDVAPVRDPARHGTVIDQTEPGYRFGDRLLRPAKVVVGR